MNFLELQTQLSELSLDMKFASEKLEQSPEQQVEVVDNSSDSSESEVLESVTEREYTQLIEYYLAYYMIQGQFSTVYGKRLYR